MPMDQQGINGENVFCFQHMDGDFMDTYQMPNNYNYPQDPMDYSQHGHMDYQQPHYDYHDPNMPPPGHHQPPPHGGPWYDTDL